MEVALNTAVTHGSEFSCIEAQLHDLTESREVLFALTQIVLCILVRWLAGEITEALLSCMGGAT